MNTATPTTFTVCALVQTLTTTSRCYGPDPANPLSGELIYTGDRTVTREVGRIEFLAMGEWVLVRVVRSPGTNMAGCWEAYSRDDARVLYKTMVEGKSYYRGMWTKGEATTKIVGEHSLPARRQTYTYGETAYMYTDVNFPAMTSPVIEMDRGRKCALQPFAFTTPPTPGDRYRHDRKAILFTDM